MTFSVPVLRSRSKDARFQRSTLLVDWVLKASPDSEQKIRAHSAHSWIVFPPPTTKCVDFFALNLAQKEKSLVRKLLTPLSNEGVKVLETAVGAVFRPTGFSLVKISIQDLDADRNPRKSGVAGQNLILI